MKKLLLLAFFLLSFTPHAHAALTDNLVSYWKYDASSGNAADSVGSNTLTNNNSTAYTTGIINNGANLVRANSNFFSITNAAQSGLSITGDLSASFWIKPSGGMSDATVPYFFGKDNFTNAGYSFYGGAGGAAGTAPNLNFTFRFIINQSVEKDFATTMTTGTWYLIALTFNHTTGAYVLYINASAVQSSTFAGAPITIGTNTSPFQEGWSSDGASGRQVDGVMDEFGIWNRVLSSSEVTSLYNNGTGCQYPFASLTSPQCFAVAVATGFGTLTFFGWQ